MSYNPELEIILYCQALSFLTILYLADMRDYLALQLSASAPSDEIQSKFLSQKSNQFSLTQAQAKMWFLYNFESDKANYNLDAYIDLKGHLHVAFLHQAINAVIKRHEALRTTFFSEEGEVHQVIQPSLSVDLPEMDIREMRPDLQENKVAEIIQERRKLSFDLREGPLLRAVLIHLSLNHYIFGIQMHHICSDAISFNIFNKELELYYTALVNDKSSEIPPLTFQYTDYARSQQQLVTTEAYQNQLVYWKTRLALAPQIINLQTDYPRSKVNPFKPAKSHFSYFRTFTSCHRKIFEGATYYSI